MSGINSWCQSYTKLTDLVAEHPEIEVTTSHIKIPEHIRPAFYQLFNTARATFVEEKLADLLNEARLLNKKYIKAEANVTKLLKFEKNRGFF